MVMTNSKKQCTAGSMPAQEQVAMTCLHCRLTEQYADHGMYVHVDSHPDRSAELCRQVEQCSNEQALLVNVTFPF